VNISLIIPCYNEELNIQKGVLDRIGNYSLRDNAIKEVIIVDDGSTDLSSEIIKKKYLKLFNKFSLIEIKHQGKAMAVIAGIERAGSEYVVFADIDQATPIEEVKKIYSAFNKGHEIVIGSRYNARSGAPILRRVQSRGFTFIRSILIGLNGIHDTQCGFKGFKTDIALQIIKHLKVFASNHEVKGSSVSAAFDLEFLFIAKKLGYDIKEVPVEWRHAETKNVAFIKDSIETIADILKIRVNDFSGKY